MKTRKFTLLLMYFLLANGLFAQFWLKQNIDFALPSLGYEIRIVDDANAWSWGRGGAFSSGSWDQSYLDYSFGRTTDGGENWSSGTFPFNGTEGDLTSMAATSAAKAWVSFVDFSTYESTIYTTNNGGTSWVEANIQVGANWVDNIHFFDNDNGVIIADPASNEFNIWTTANGGDTWQKVSNANIPNATDNDEYGVQGVFATQGDKIWFNTYNNRVYYSEDKGKAWEVWDAPQGAIGLGLQMTSDEEGNVYLAVINFNTGRYQFFRRKNSQSEWTNITPPDNNKFIYFTSIPGTGKLIQLNNSDTKTRISSDRGDSWMVVDSVDASRKNFVFFKDAVTGYAFSAVTASGTKEILKYSGSPLSGLLSSVILDVELTTYPNPVSTTVNVKMKSNTYNDYWILINDLDGNLVYKKEYAHINRIDEQVNTENLPSGVYTITVCNSKGAMSKKILKI
ncbi:MAG: T9SS type A sorting domain-containing protein [Saprospiraceae bacterium]|nr:T9SS type A sorting domain-containing protein [Saprospiraceae bacterium]MBK8849718.1 T9SS type A sorting domain-containing protein [Saprospiraceae bacterium]